MIFYVPVVIYFYNVYINYMTRIGLLSDTHNYLDKVVFEHFKNCDELWHAGDFGTAAIADELKNFKPHR